MSWRRRWYTAALRALTSSSTTLLTTTSLTAGCSRRSICRRWLCVHVDVCVGQARTKRGRAPAAEQGRVVGRCSQEKLPPGCNAVCHPAIHPMQAGGCAGSLAGAPGAAPHLCPPADSEARPRSACRPPEGTPDPAGCRCRCRRAGSAPSQPVARARIGAGQLAAGGWLAAAACSMHRCAARLATSAVAYSM